MCWEPEQQSSSEWNEMFDHMIVLPVWFLTCFIVKVMLLSFKTVALILLTILATDHLRRTLHESWRNAFTDEMIPYFCTMLNYPCFKRLVSLRKRTCTVLFIIIMWERKWFLMSAIIWSSCRSLARHNYHKWILWKHFMPLTRRTIFPTPRRCSRSGLKGKT